jgi:probable rRNA maturation factor
MLEINNTTRQRINFKKIRALAAQFLRAYKKPGALVSLAVVGPSRMRQLNKRYRKIDKTTDVLSFTDETATSGGAAGRKRQGNTPPYLGEIVINIQEAAKVVKYRLMLAKLGLDLARRRPSAKDYIFYFLFVHGLLHLVGYNDANERERRAMLRRGKRFLDQAEKML